MTMKVRGLMVLAAILLVQGVGIAKSVKRQDSYNYSRALEEAKKGNKADAMDFLSKEVAENPNNGYAYFTMALIQAEGENYSNAMESINKALKKIPKKDKEQLGRSYAIRGHLYTVVGDTVQSLSDYDSAMQMNPKDINILEDYGQLLYELNRYDEADKLYSEIITINPASVTGYMGLGRDAYATGNYDEAVRQYNTVIGMYDDYSSGYSFRAESYLKLGKYLEAADDIMKALSIDNDKMAHSLHFEFPDDQTSLVATKLKGMAVKNPHDAEWNFYMGQLYHERKMYREAIDAFNAAYDVDAYPMFLKYIADCHENLGDFAAALQSIDQAQQMDPDDLDMIQVKADVLGESGDIEGAIAEWSRYIEKSPDFYGGYYRRGFFEDNSGRTDDALADYEMAIMLAPEYAYSYLGKGDMLMRKGEIDKAMEAYRKVMERDTVPNNESCAMYALLALGERDKAIDFMEKIIANDSTNNGNYYDGACFYSRTGDIDKSLANLRKAFELGFRRFHHVLSDDDLEELRKTEGFRNLMNEYDTSLPVESSGLSEQEEMVESEQETVRVPFTHEDGCLSVKCSVNELPLRFIFDTGACMVSLSMVEANFMLKNGYLKKDDFVGSQRFVDANGDISEGTVVNLRNIDFGGIHLNNVKASVVRNQKAPLLLGQSVLGRLGKIEIDNPGQKLVITHKITK